MSPMFLCPSVCSRRYLHVMGMQGALLLFGHPHVFGCLHMCPKHPCICMLPCMSVCSRGCLHVLWGKHSICWVSGEHLHICQAFGVHHVSSCTFLVVHYVSSLYFHSYDYYSSSDYGVFWYVISIIGDHGSLF